MSEVLLRNDIFQYDGKRLRLLHVVAAINAVYVIDLDTPNADPWRWDLEELKRRQSKGGLRLLAAPDASNRPLSTSLADLAVRDQRWSRIEGIVSNPDIWDRTARIALLKQHAESLGVTVKTVRANLRLWWCGGQTIEALLGDYHNSGKVEETTSGALTIVEESPNGKFTAVFAPAKNRARGRRPIDSDYEPFAIPPDLRQKILEVARAHYESDEIKTVRGAAIAVLDDLFSLRDANGEPLRNAKGGAVLRPRGERPSHDQIRYMLRKVLVLSGTHKKRYGAADYDNNHSPSTGSVKDDCLGPGDIYEIDATVIDLWVVAKANRKIVIGKPNLFLVIDRDSRLIVGFYMTLENPSWTEATQAILSISGDWEGLCARLNVPYSKSDWPAVGVMPNRFFGDRADMITYASNALCDGVSTSVTNAPALSSPDKAIVESGFKVVHVPLKQEAPGYEPPVNIGKRQGKMYHKGAALSLDELAAIFLRIVITHNRKEKEGYQASAEEIMQELPCNPIEIWKRGIETRMGTGARMPIDLLRRKLRPKSVARVKNDGIHFGNCIYEAPELKEWFARASLRGEFDVTVSYTTNLVDNIIVMDKFDAHREHMLHLTTTSAEFKGYTFAEVAAVFAAKRRARRASNESNNGLDVALRQDIRSVTLPAIAATKQLTIHVTPGMRLSGGDVARDAEARERRRKIQSFENPAAHYGQEPSDIEFRETLDSTVPPPQSPDDDIVFEAAPAPMHAVAPLTSESATNALLDILNQS